MATMVKIIVTLLAAVSVVIQSAVAGKRSIQGKSHSSEDEKTRFKVSEVL